MLNRVTLQGRLTADPELRRTQSGTAVTSFSLAVEKDFKDKDSGQRGVDFINCISWKQTAEHIARYMAKGRMTVVEGKVHTRNYTDKEGNRRYVTEILVERMYFAGDKQNEEGSGGTYSYEAIAPQQFQDLGEAGDGELPF